MSRLLSPYQAYKDTGLPWVGRCPAHWSLRRMKYLVDERVEKGYPDEPLLTASQSRGVIPKADYGSRTVEAQKDLHLLKLVEPGDYVISLRSFQGGIEFAHVRGIISPAYTVLEPKPDVRRGYYEHFFKSADFINSMTLFVTGIREGQNIDYVRLSRAYMPVPPPDEQDAIGRFIRHLDQRVNLLIKTKRRLIELLNEQKQAVIRELLEGTGEELDRWQIGHFARVGNGSTPYRGNSSYWSDSGDGFPWLNSASVNQFRIGSASQFVSEIALRECHLPKVKPGSILVAITGQGKTRGTAAMLDIEATINQHVAYITVTGDRVQPEYLHLVLVASYQDLRNLSEASGSTKAALTCADIKSFKVPVRERSLQTSLVLQIRTESSKIDQAISKTRDEIELLKEYRTRLVADVVTGQLDVRHLDLPEVEESLIEAIDADSPEDLELADEETED